MRMLLLAGLFHFLLRPLSILWDRLPQNLQGHCSDLFEFHLSSTRDSLRSFFCGLPLDHLEHKLLLIDSGLLHVFVVSGSHILALDQLLIFFRVSRGFRYLLLGLYSLVTGFEPPVVRALLFLCLRECTNLGWAIGTLPRVVISWLLTLLWFPQWLHSQSLLMSVWASFGIQLFLLHNYEQTAPQKEKFLWLWRLSLWMYLFMIPVFPSGVSHPLSILYNALVTPLLTILMLILALLGWLSLLETPFNFLLDSFWQLLGLATPFNIFRNDQRHWRYPTVLGLSLFGWLAMSAIAGMVWVWQMRKRRRMDLACRKNL